MAVRCCCRLFAYDARLSNNQRCSRKLYESLFRSPHRPGNSSALSLPHSRVSSSSLVPREDHLATRGLRTATCTYKDVAIDEENPFYEKYSGNLAKIKGLSKHQTQARIKAARLQEKSRETAFVPPSRPSPHSQYTLLRPPSLDSVMHTDMIVDKSAEEISVIWREFHKDRDTICAIVPAEKYVELLAKAVYCPYFVYPLPRDEGYEFMFAQFSGHRCHFTSLINYQQYQEKAPVILTLTHYTDLQDSKGIVLMAGEIDTAHLTTFEAQYLANQVQLYYNSQDAERYALLRQFNHEPEAFNHRKLVEQLTNSSVGTSSVNTSSVNTPPVAVQQQT